MRTENRNPIAVAAAATVALLVALALAGAARGLALYAYVLFLGALGLTLTARRTSSSVRRTGPLERLVNRRGDHDGRAPQFESIARQLSAGQSSAFELHHRLRPLVRQIASTQLARRYGVDLDRRPERAQQLLGPRTWELVRPDREPPAERLLRGWSPKELADLVDELEQI